MTEPKPIGTVAKIVLEHVQEIEVADIEDALAITAAVARGDTEEVLNLAEEIALRNLDAFKILTNLAADKVSKSEDVVMDAKIRKSKRQQGNP